MTTGERIRNARKNAKLTQKTLGEALGVSPQMIAQYENGDRLPKVETLQRIANALNISLLDLGVLDTDVLTALKILQDEGVETYLAHSSKDTDKILDCFEKLNNNGQKRVVQYAEDLLKIPEYKK